MDSKREETENIQDWITGSGFLVNPTPTVIRELSHSLTIGDGKLNVLITEKTLRGVEREFTIGSHLKTLSENDTVRFRELHKSFQTNLFVTSSVVGAFVDFNDLTFAVGSEKEQLINNAVPSVEKLWENSNPIDVRMSEFELVKKTFTNSFADGEVFFNRFLDTVSEMEFVGLSNFRAENSQQLFRDRWCVHASILIAGALMNLKLKEIGLCAEQCGISSRSSLSRVKEELVEHGFITTSAVKGGIGRPNMQLEVVGLHTGSNASMLAEKAYHNIRIVNSDEQQ